MQTLHENAKTENGSTFQQCRTHAAIGNPVNANRFRFLKRSVRFQLSRPALRAKNGGLW